MGLTENVECHLNTNDLRPTYRALKKLFSKYTSQVSAIKAADGWPRIGRRWADGSLG